jgi:hypothetical protein
MPQPKRRLDPYGVPIPPLRDVREPEPLATRPTNLERRAELLALLEEAWPLILVRGWHGSLVLEVSVVDGVLQSQMVERVRRRR